MAAVPNSVPLSGTVAPYDEVDTYAVTEEKWGKYSFRTVETLADRNAISAGRRMWNMTCVVWNEAKAADNGTFVLTKGKKNTTITDNDNWVKGSTEIYTKEEIDEIIENLPTNLIWKEPVANFAALSAAYTTPVEGWTAKTTDDNKTYRYDAETTTWKLIDVGFMPAASDTMSGLMSKDHHKKLNDLGAASSTTSGLMSSTHFSKVSGLPTNVVGFDTTGGGNFNSYTTAGLHFINNGTMSNQPAGETDTYWTLLVIGGIITGANYPIYQQATPKTYDKMFFRRGDHDGSNYVWQAWHQVTSGSGYLALTGGTLTGKLELKNSLDVKLALDKTAYAENNNISWQDRTYDKWYLGMKASDDNLHIQKVNYPGGVKTITDVAEFNNTDNNLTLKGDLQIEKDNPWLTLKSSHAGTDDGAQGAGISIGEDGKKGSAALHLTYTGNGYSYIGMGAVTAGKPGFPAMRMYYTKSDLDIYGKTLFSTSTTNMTGTSIVLNGGGGALALPNGGVLGDFGAPATMYPLRLFEDMGWNFTLQNVTGVAFRIKEAQYTKYNDPSLFEVNELGNCTVSGNFTAGGDVTAYSDARLKKNITTLDCALELVERLRGVRYQRIDKASKPEIGLIAQEVLEVIPEVVTLNEDTDRYSIDYGKMVGLLINAVKELSEKVKILEQNGQRV